MSDEEYTREELEAMTVAELRDLCIDNELPSEGKKAELVDRLLGEEAEEDDSDDGQAPVPQVPKYAPGDVVEQGEVERETRDAWWCPLCDHSTYKHVGPGETANVCGGCGAYREGSTVKRLARI